ncbi:MAG: rod shape-determining protein RodA [Chloroflexota bacterium]|nr:rod shape-determining protein RodA [Dehalococcoidia bacterium]MDW8252695.1 rod shape-determining protein RodA [Chloroflexota bacterium]
MDVRVWRTMDPLIVAAMAGLIVLGLVLIYSASATGEWARGPLVDHPMVRQLFYAAIGFGALLLAMMLDYRLLGRAAPVLYALAVLALIAVLVVGQESYGAKRWINLPVVQFQPSEFSKLVLIITLAKFFADREGSVRSLRTLTLSLLLAVIPMGLIFLEPDVGTTLVVGAIWLGMALMSGIPLRYFGILTLAGLIVLPLIYEFALQDYQRARIETFLDPERDPLGRSYNLIQAEISIGSGGFFGKGLMAGTQTQLNYLRVQTTDFIFSVLGEELGFLGGVLLLGLFTVILLRAIGAAERARDPFARLLVSGICIMLLVQTTINIAVNTRLIPATGVPLPFISAGGTSLITCMIAIGLIESVAARRSRG